MAKLRLSGAQVTRIQEALTRYNENAYIRTKMVTEELVEDILEVVLPDELKMMQYPIYQINVDGTVRRIPWQTNTPQTPNAQQNVKES